MEAQRPASVAGLFSFRAAPPLGSLLRCVAWSTAAVLLVTALVLLARRLAGALEQPLAGGALVALGAGASTLAFLLHGAWRSGGAGVVRRTESAQCELLFTLVISAALAALGTAVSLAGSSRAALLFMWAVLIGQESAWWIAVVRRSRPGRVLVRLARRWRSGRSLGVGWGWGWGRRRVSASRRSGRAAENRLNESRAGAGSVPFVRQRVADEDATPIAPPSQETADRAALAPGVSQKLTRIAEAEGETLYGLLRADFAPRQRTQSLHVAFCPPLVDAPTMECRQVEGPETSIKAAQVQPFGARFDLRLATIPQEPTSVVIQFEAHCQPRDASESRIPNPQSQIPNKLP